MAVTAANVRVGLTGAVSKAPYGTAAPTNATTAINVAFTDSGAISEDGVSLSLPDAGDATPIKIWQGGAQVRTLRIASEDLASLTFTMLETNKTSVETYFGVTVTQTSAHGTFDFVGGTVPTPSAYVLDVLDGENIHRYHVPRGMRASVGELVYKNDEPLGYEVTLEMEQDATAGYAFRSFFTDLQTV